MDRLYTASSCGTRPKNLYAVMQESLNETHRIVTTTFTPFTTEGAMHERAELLGFSALVGYKLIASTSAATDGTIVMVDTLVSVN
jgi:hypothetical protein